MTVSTTRLNLAANLLGRALALLTTVAFLPVYLRLLGPSGYGLVGFYTALISVLALTDLGLSATLSRELARLSGAQDVAMMRDTVRTMESVSATILGVVVCALLAGSRFVSENWVNSDAVDGGTVLTSVRLMAVAASFQVWTSIYQGGLVGLQRHVRLNVVLGVAAVARGAVTITALVLVDRSPSVFFVCQVAIALGMLLWIRAEVWSAISLPQHHPHFRGHVVSAVWRYASGMLVMTLTGTVLMQSDKIVLSRVLALDTFGFYTIAWTVAQLPLSLLSTPIQNTYFPRMAQLFARDDRAGLAVTYHSSSQTMAFAVLPIAATVAAFPGELLYVWLGSESAVGAAAGVLRLLVVGSALAALTAVPYAAQLASGWTSFPVAWNCFAVVLFVPALVLLVSRLGLDGAGIAWVTLNGAHVVVIAALMFRRILVGERRAWLGHAVIVPGVVSIGTALLLQRVLEGPEGRVALAVMLFLCWLTVQSLTLACTPRGRQLARETLRRITPA